MKTNINTYKNVKSPYVNNTVWYTDILEEIRTGKRYGELISKARYYGKVSLIFDEIKTTQLPTYTVNATFNGRRRTDSILGYTGFLYLDIDGTTKINLENPYIYATYKSISGTGRGVIVRVRGLNINNLKTTYRSIGELLDINPDYSCADITRQVVISYDPEIVINLNSKVYNVCESEEDKERYNKPLPTIKKGISSDLMYHTATKDIRWDNLDEYEIDDYYRIFDEKIQTIEIYVPRVIKVGRRYYTISILINNIVYLNPRLTNERVYGFLMMLNSRCQEPLSKSELYKIQKNILLKRDIGELEPIYNRTRRVIFSEDCPMSIRRKITGIASGLVRSENSLQKIQIALDDWDLFKGKVTNVELAKAANVHLNTVKKYLREVIELKEQKEIINNQFTKK